MIELTLFLLSVYSLSFLWLILIQEHRSESAPLKHISEHHASSYIGRTNLTHLWTTLGISNLLIAQITNSPLRGFEQISLILLSLFPIEKQSKLVVDLSANTTTFIHYTLTFTYFVTPNVVFGLSDQFYILCGYLTLSTVTILSLVLNFKFTIYLESISSSFISVYYLCTLCSKLKIFG
jgi:hypothetical protein